MTCIILLFRSHFLEHSFVPRNELAVEHFVVKRPFCLLAAPHGSLLDTVISHIWFTGAFSYFLLNYEHDCKALDSLFSLMTINSPNTCWALVIMPWLFRPEPSPSSSLPHFYTSFSHCPEGPHSSDSPGELLFHLSKLIWVPPSM